MDLNQQIADLLSAHQFQSNLDEVKLIINQLNIKPKYPIILVGGTNGKGSTCAYLTKILMQSGYRIGTFSSPHVFEYNERIAINNTPINNLDLSFYLAKVINATESNLGLFKTFTLAAHLYFIQQNIDIAVVEVGIGGLNDVTNLFDPEISVITTIDFDHCNILGNSLEEIGLQKAGIFRSEKTAFIGMPTPPKSIINYANQINTPLEIIDVNFKYIKHELSFDVYTKNNKYFGIPLPSLRGSEQLNNATIAIAVIDKLKSKFPVTLSAIKHGVLTTTLVGRLTILPGLPQIILDVAHNPQAVSSLLKNMLKLPFTQHTYAVFGVAADKDVTTIISLAKNYFDQWFIAPINSTRSLPNNQLTKLMQKAGIDKNKITACDTIKSAVDKAKQVSKNDDKIVCFGSFLVVEEAYKCN